MPLASCPARANRKVQTIPYPPWFAPRACCRATRAAFGEHDPPSTPLGVVTLGYRDQLVEVEAMAAVTGGRTAAH